MDKVKLVGHYVYVDCRKNGSAFYVGKGSGSRFYTELRPNKHWMAIALKEKGYQRYLIKDELTEEQAFRLEKKLIKKYGRENLCNATDGGDGAVGIKRTAEHKRKNAEFLTSLNKSRIGKPISDKVKKAVVESNRRRKGERRNKCVV